MVNTKKPAKIVKELYNFAKSENTVTNRTSNKINPSQKTVQKFFAIRSIFPIFAANGIHLFVETGQLINDSERIRANLGNVTVKNFF